MKSKLEIVNYPKVILSILDFFVLPNRRAKNVLKSKSESPQLRWYSLFEIIS